MKDYYKILEIDVSATLQEIKKSYRRLAQQYHPDKNMQDPYAAAAFTEIKEAYEVLTDPGKKEYYLEQRWFQQSQGKKKHRDNSTPVSILKNVLEFDRHLSKLDVHRMNKEGLYNYLMNELLPEDVIQTLNVFNDTSINEKIVHLVLKNIFIIPAVYTETFSTRLNKINTGAEVKKDIIEIISRYNHQQLRNRYQPVYIFIIVLILILVMYFFN
jgi:molecular chaperone DnaJ